jgi:hypothetical protein
VRAQALAAVAKHVEGRAIKSVRVIRDRVVSIVTE